MRRNEFLAMMLAPFLASLTGKETDAELRAEVIKALKLLDCPPEKIDARADLFVAAIKRDNNGGV